VIFKQIAGILARRIVFTKKTGDTLARGERVGMIKFGSRVEVLFDPAAAVQVKVGQHVAGGSTILALAPVTPAQERLPERARWGEPSPGEPQGETAAPRGGRA
jgi:phosphatidylserine decarboxylase